MSMSVHGQVTPALDLPSLLPMYLDSLGVGGGTIGRLGEGSVASWLCTTAHPLHTRFANVFGASVPDTTMRPDPRLGALYWLTAVPAVLAGGWLHQRLSPRQVRSLAQLTGGAKV